MGRIRMKQVEGCNRITLDKAQEGFLRSCRLRNLSPKTIEYYEEDLFYFQKHTNIEFADEISKNAMEDFIDHEIQKGNRITAINSRVRGLRVFFTYCAEQGYCEAFKYPLLKEDEGMKEPYTDEELQRLLRKPQSEVWTDWRNWAVINTFLATGIRASTLINIRIADVDFEHKSILLTKLKNRKQQTVPLSEALHGILNEYLRLWDWDSMDYLFPTQSNTQMDVHSLASAIRRYNLSRDVQKTSLHLFRHTFAKNYVLAGGGMIQLQSILGHSTLDMTRKYVNLYGQDIHRDFDKLNPLNNALHPVQEHSRIGCVKK